MPHRPNHRSAFGNRFPEYGSPGFGSAVSDRLRRQTLPRPQGLLAPNDIDVSQYIMDQGPPPRPITAPMESGVSPRQTGFTGSVEWDVMDGNIYDPLGASVTETEEERRLRELREKQERGRRNALASGFGEASAALLAPREWQPMANLGLSPGYAGRSRRFA